MTQILDEAFNELKRLGFTGNQCQFSEDWLNKSPRYFSMCKSTGREPSIDALGRLAANLKFRHDHFKTNKLGDLRLRAEQIHPIVKRVWAALYHRALDRPRVCGHLTNYKPEL